MSRKPKSPTGKGTKGKTKINVSVRVRPLNSDEKSGNHKEAVEVQGNNIVVQKNFDKKNFNFDKVFDEKSTQAEVFKGVAKGCIDDVFRGYQSTIFVYGQTGTGKTFTLCNPTPGQEGIVVHGLKYIFDRIKDEQSSFEHEVTLEYIQIYNEKIMDLLNPESEESLAIRQAEGRVYIQDITEAPIHTVREALDIVDRADQHRVTALTKMNAQSSRSHSCLMLTIKRREIINEDDETLDKSSLSLKSVTIGTLFLVDLAGSERVKKTEAQGLRRKEANYINLSLSTLGQVIHALEVNKAHVPYRNSKLTRLLQNSLGGTGKTSIIVTIGPSSVHTQETISSLLFGQRAMKVKTDAQITKQVDYRALSLKLQREIEELNSKMLEMESYLEDEISQNETLESKLNLREEDIGKLKIRISQLSKDRDEDIDLLENELLSIQEKKQQLQDNVIDLEKERDTLLKQFDIMEKKEETYKLELGKVQKLYEDQLAQLTNCQSELEEAKENVLDKQATIESAEFAFNNAQQDISDLEEEKATLVTKCEFLEKRISDVEQEASKRIITNEEYVQSLQSELDVKNEKMIEFEEQVQQLFEDVAAFDEAKKQRISDERTIEMQSKQLEIAKDTMESNKTQIQNYLDEIALKDSRLKILSESKDSTSNLNEELQETIRALEEKLKDNQLVTDILKEDKVKLQQELDNSKVNDAVVKQYEAQLVEKQEHINDLQELQYTNDTKLSSAENNISKLKHQVEVKQRELDEFVEASAVKLSEYKVLMENKEAEYHTLEMDHTTLNTTQENLTKERDTLKNCLKERLMELKLLHEQAGLTYASKKEEQEILCETNEISQTSNVNQLKQNLQTYIKSYVSHVEESPSDELLQVVEDAQLVNEEEISQLCDEISKSIGCDINHLQSSIQSVQDKPDHTLVEVLKEKEQVITEFKAKSHALDTLLQQTKQSLEETNMKLKSTENDLVEKGQDLESKISSAATLQQRIQQIEEVLTSTVTGVDMRHIAEYAVTNASYIGALKTQCHSSMDKANRFMKHIFKVKNENIDPSLLKALEWSTPLEHFEDNIPLNRALNAIVTSHQQQALINTLTKYTLMLTQSFVTSCEELSRLNDTFISYKVDQHEYRRKDKAARVIQRYYRLMKNTLEMERIKMNYDDLQRQDARNRKYISVLKRNREELKSELKTFKSIIGQSRGETGQLLIKQSFTEMTHYFNVWKSYFLYEESVDQRIKEHHDRKSRQSSPGSPGGRTSRSNSTASDYLPQFKRSSSHRTGLTISTVKSPTSKSKTVATPPNSAPFPRHVASPLTFQTSEEN